MLQPMDYSTKEEFINDQYEKLSETRKNSIDHILKGVKQLVDVGIPLDEKTERGL